MAKFSAIKRDLILVCLATLALGWTLVKPMRVLAPEWNNVRCVGTVCIDAPRPTLAEP